MRPVEAVFFWAAVALYVVAFAASVFGAVFRRRGVESAGFAFAVAAFASHTVAVILRWALAGHVPVGNRYELNLSGTWLAVLVLLGLGLAAPRVRLVVAGGLPPILLALGLGVTAWKVIAPLSPAYDSYWLIVHVVFAFLSFGCFVGSFSAATFYLIEDTGRRHRLSHRLPPLPELEEISYRLVVAGFILEAVMIATGAVWANDLWGSYWSWDPVETWSLVSFLVYAVYLHLRTFAGWRGRRSAAVAIVGLVFVFLSFWGVQWLVPTVHDVNQF